MNNSTGKQEEISLWLRVPSWRWRNTKNLCLACLFLQGPEFLHSLAVGACEAAKVIKVQETVKKAVAGWYDILQCPHRDDAWLANKFFLEKLAM